MISSLAAISILVAACGTTSSSGGTPAKGGTLTIDNESGTLWNCGFNPFNGNVNFLVFGPVYEPLVYVNLLNGKETPMLASSYKWSADNKTLTFTIRSGVKWSDGQALTADDVVYTFQLIKSNSALDLQSVWSVLSDVTKQGSDQVVMTFQSPSAPSLYTVANQQPIVPKHVWASITDPVAENNPVPVGSGPFKIAQGGCTPQNIAYTRNPSYWQSGLPYLDKINYPAFTDNDPANQYLATGQAQWGGQFIPNIDTYYINKDKANRHYWFPPIQNVNVFINVTKKPFDKKLVRQALAYGIDRPKVSKIGEYGYQPPGNQTGVVTPTFNNWYDSNQAAKHGYKFDPAKAQSLLQQAGFTKGSDGIFKDSSGTRLSFPIISISGYTDWTASLQVVADNLKQIGVEVKEQDFSHDDYFNKLFTGDFTLGYGSLSTLPGPNPYYELRNTLHSKTSAPIGQTASGDYGRWNDATTDSLFDQFVATTDSATQHRIMNQIQGIMLEQVPLIPVTESVAWYQYDTRLFTGWPTKEDPYAAPAPWNTPDWEQVMLKVHKK
ncbi:MAG TPA: ABC transporter substrate-binding protein [Candidatus Angelobacter sp.]|nr:ABC transporter substrate-binding protein [Candidatus Angelobacter sp.]